MARLAELDRWRDENKASRQEASKHFGEDLNDYLNTSARKTYYQSRGLPVPEGKFSPFWTRERVEEMVNWGKANEKSFQETADHFNLNAHAYQQARQRTGFTNQRIFNKKRGRPPFHMQNSQPTKPLQAPVKYVDLPSDYGSGFKEAAEMAAKNTAKGIYIAVICQDLKSLQEVIKGVTQ